MKVKKLFHTMTTMTAMLAVMVSCSQEDSFSDWADTSATGNNGQTPQSSNTPAGNAQGAAASALTGELATFDVVLNTSALTNEAALTVNSDDEDMVENYTESNRIGIHFDGTSATVTGSADGVEVTTSGAHVVVTSTAKGLALELSGQTTDGSLKIYSEKKLMLTLNGVSITNPTGAAINSQCKKRHYVVLADGTENTLADGTTYTTTEGEDMKGTLFGEGQLLFSGSGSLRVSANAKHGIVSDDYIVFRPGNNISVTATTGHCVKSNDGIWVRGGVINCETSGTAAKGMTTDGHVQIDGGRTTLIATGGGEYDADEGDVTGAAGIKADSTFTMTAGELYVKSTGAGGKGISADQAISIEGGTLRVITEGRKYTYGNYDTSAKGIKSDTELTVSGGDLMVRTLGSEGSEGIESKGKLNIKAGSVGVYAYDDAINSKKEMTVSGGYVFAYATNNDGIDSNGALTISGGLVIGIGTTQPEDGFDCDQNTMTISGGTVIGIGGGSSAPSENTAKQPVAIVGVSSLAGGQYLTLDSADGQNLFAFLLPRSYQQATVLVSSPSMQKGSNYTLATGASVTASGSEFFGFIDKATASGGTTLSSLTLNSMLTTSNFSGGMGGGMPGGMPGGRW